MAPLHRGVVALAVSVAVLLPASVGAGPAAAQPAVVEQPPPATASVGGFHVAGNEIIGPNGQPVIFKGVNAIDFVNNQSPPAPTSVAGMDRSIDAIRGWGFNLVRVYLMANLWLNPACADTPNTPGDNQAVPGNYRTWVQEAVQRITADGMAAELTLWSSNSGCTDNWEPMADYPTAITFWQQVATTFKGNPLVIFEPYNEPDLTPPLPTDAQGQQTMDPDSTWLNGGWMWGSSGCNPCHEIAGMQQMYNAIRSTGATNLVFVTGETLGPNNTPGDPYDSIKVALRDPVAGYNIVYATHIYNGSNCGQVPALDTGVSKIDENSEFQGNPTDINEAILPVTAVYPVVLDEFGSNCVSFDAEGFAAEENNANVVAFADEHGLGYAAFSWDGWCCSEASEADSWGLLYQDNGSDWQPYLTGIPIYDDLHNRPCTLECPYLPSWFDAVGVPDPNQTLAATSPAVSAVSEPSVTVAPSSAAGASGQQYTVQFATSQEGLLTAGGAIRITAAPGTSFYHVATPTIVDLTSGRNVGAGCCVQIAPGGNAITVPLAGTVSPGDQVLVRLSGVINPAAGNQQVKVSTSTDRQPVASAAYPITSAQAPANLSVTLSSVVPDATGVNYTATFTTSSTGGMSGLWPGGTVTLTAPAGTDFADAPGYASLWDETTGQPVPGGYLSEDGSSFTFGLRYPVAAGQTLQLQIGGVTNPGPGSYTLTVQTGSDVLAATSQTYRIAAASAPTAVPEPPAPGGPGNGPAPPPPPMPATPAPAPVS